MFDEIVVELNEYFTSSHDPYGNPYAFDRRTVRPLSPERDRQTRRPRPFCRSTTHMKCGCGVEATPGPTVDCAMGSPLACSCNFEKQALTKVLSMLAPAQRRRAEQVTAATASDPTIEQATLHVNVLEPVAAACRDHVSGGLRLRPR